MGTEAIVVARRSAAEREVGTLSQQLINILTDILSLVTSAPFWQEFHEEAEQWTKSGKTSRFEKSNRPGLVLDKKTGELWPVRMVQLLSRYSIFD